MKIFFFCAVLLINCSLLFSQTNTEAPSADTSQRKQFGSWGRYEDSTSYEPVILPDYFLLGTLSDYMGRFRYIDRKNQVDRYYPYEKPLVLDALPVKQALVLP